MPHTIDFDIGCIEAIRDGLRANRTLTYLDISENHLFNLGAHINAPALQIFGEALKHCSLRSINIMGCTLEQKGGKCVNCSRLNCGCPLYKRQPGIAFTHSLIQLKNNLQSVCGMLYHYDEITGYSWADSKFYRQHFPQRSISMFERCSSHLSGDADEAVIQSRDHVGDNGWGSCKKGRRSSTGSKRDSFATTVSRRTSYGSAELVSVGGDIDNFPEFETFRDVVTLDLRKLHISDTGMILVAERELMQNHFVHEVLLTENPQLSSQGLWEMSSLLVENVALKRIVFDQHSGLASRFPNWYDDLQKKSFLYRMAVSLFVRGGPLPTVPMRAVLEFLLGKGPQVNRFLRWQ